MADLLDVFDFAPDSHGESRTRQLKLAELASRQHGVVAYRQLVEIGFRRGAIEHRLASGRLHRIHRGVYAVGHQVIPPRGRSMAAVLACGTGAVVSHRSAASVWELRPSSAASVDVTVPGTRRRRRAGIVLHQVRRLPPEDCTVRDGVPLTTVARTLLDLAEVLRPEQLDRTFEQAERLRLLDMQALDQLCRNRPGRHGLGPLVARLAQEHAPASLETRSELERRFLRLSRDAGLPQPAVNALVEGLEVDAAWLDRRVIVELDGHGFHGTRAAFERDRKRDMALQLAGYSVLRLTHRRLETEGPWVVEALRSLLAAREVKATSAVETRR